MDSILTFDGYRGLIRVHHREVVPQAAQERVPEERVLAARPPRPPPPLEFGGGGFKENIKKWQTGEMATRENPWKLWKWKKSEDKEITEKIKERGEKSKKKIVKWWEPWQ